MAGRAETVTKAFYKSVPVMAGYIVLGIGFGILLRDAGYGVVWALIMSLFIYAGSMQYVGVGLLTGGASVLTAVITTRYDRLYIHGSKGSIRSEVEYNQQGDACYRIFTQDEVIERKVSISQNYSLEIAQMCRCIHGNETPHVTPEFSIKNAQLMDRVFKEIGY